MFLLSWDESTFDHKTFNPLHLYVQRTEIIDKKTIVKIGKAKHIRQIFFHIFPFKSMHIGGSNLYKYVITN